MWVELYNFDEEGVDALANIHELSNRNLINLFLTSHNSKKLFSLVHWKDGSELDGYYNEHFVIQHGLLRDLAIHHCSQEPVEQRKRLIMDIRGNGLAKWSIGQIQPFSARLLSIYTDETFFSSWYNMQLPKTEVLILNIQTRSYNLPEFMEKMDQLKVLIIVNYGFFPAELTNFPLLGCLSNLKRIRLEHVSVSSLGKSTLQLSNLQKISLIMCEIGNAFRNCIMEIPCIFPNLMEIDVDRCNDLLELLEGLCDIVDLKKLSITNCHELDALPEGLGKLTNLEMLRLSNCTKLIRLPESTGSLHQLKFLDISDCLNMNELSILMGGLCGLQKLSMRGCGLCSLPPSVNDLWQLKHVICDEGTADLWEPLKVHLTNLEINVLKEDINLT